MTTEAQIHNFAFFLLTFYFLKLVNQFVSIMQNKPNFRKSQMNVTFYMKSKYEELDTWLSGKNKPNSNPIQTQYKANQTQFPKSQKWT